MKTKPANTKNQTESFPVGIKCRNVTVKVYRATVKKSGYQFYQVPSYASGKRRWLNFANLEAAKSKALEIATAQAGVENNELRLTGQDALDYRTALDILAPAKVRVTTAVTVYAEALKVLDDDRILEACRFFAKKHSAKNEPKKLSAVVQEFVASRESAGVSARYLEDMRGRLGKLVADFNCNVGSVTASMLADWIAGLKLSPRSQLNYQRAITSLFEFARKRGYVARDYDEHTLLQKPQLREQDIEIYSPTEAARLLAAAPKNFIPALAVSLFAGLRSQEILRLDWSDISLERGFIEVKALKSKTGSRRLVPLADNLRRWLAPYSKPDGLVFPFSRPYFHECQGTAAARTANPDRHLKPVPWRHNAARHSYASYRLAESQDAAKTAFELGHAVAMTFRCYRELCTPQEAKAFFGIMPPAREKVISLPTASVS
jgi:integrase